MGAIEDVNCLGDDVEPGKETSFPQAVKLRDDDVIASSWLVDPSREDRDGADAAAITRARVHDSRGAGAQ